MVLASQNIVALWLKFIHVLKILILIACFAQTQASAVSSWSNLFDSGLRPRHSRDVFKDILDSLRYSRSVQSGSPFSSFEFLVEPVDVVVAKGESAKFHCSTRGGAGRVKIEWRKEDLPLPLTNDGRRNILGNGSLIISNVVDAKGSGGGHGSATSPDQSDEGRYQCIATVEDVGTFVSAKAELQIAALSRFESQPKDRSVEIGFTTIIACQIAGAPVPAITWYKDGLALEIGKDPRITLFPITGSLEIQNFSAADQGEYHCKADNKDKHRLSDEGKLKAVWPNGPSDPKEPVFEVRPQGVLLRQGQNALLECAANGHPVPVIQWLKDEKLINATLSSRHTIVGQVSLLINDVDEGDAGQYTCRAVNSVDSVDSSAALRVHVPPSFVVRPKSVEAKETDDVVFECQAEGVPGPAISWLRNGEVLSASDYFQIEGSRLKILGVVISDSGVFQCLAENTVGSAQASAQLVVKPSGRNRSASGHVVSVKNEDFRMANKERNAEAVVVTEVVVDSDVLTNFAKLSSADLNEDSSSEVEHKPHSSSSSIAGSGVPSPPIRLRSTFVGSRHVKLQWDAPVLPNGAIVTYSIYYRHDGSTRERVLNSSSVGEVMVNMLQPETVYLFRVVAYNRNGPGLSSEPLKIKTATEKAVPEKVVNLKATALSSTSLSVTWDPPAGDSLPVSLYKLYYSTVEADDVDDPTPSQSFSDAGDTDHERVAGGETEIQLTEPSYVFHGLDPYVLYSFRVEAFNKYGPGATSDAVQARTFSDVPSGAPQNVSADGVTSTSIVVSWLPPLKEEQNGVITGYKIRYKAKKNTQAQTHTTDGSALSYTINDLQPGSSYTVRLSAVNVNGTGPNSAWISVSTLLHDLDESRVPASPTLITVVPRAKSLLVSWSAPVDATVVMRGYIVGWGIGLPDDKSFRLHGKHKSFSIEKLRPNKEYVVSVRAFNNMGNGFPIYETVRTLEEGAPEPGAVLEPPVGLKVSAQSSTSVQLQWSDRDIPSSFGSVSKLHDKRIYIVRYAASFGGKPKYANSTTNTASIDGLKPNTQYEFAVKTVRGSQESGWSMSSINYTLAIAPSSPPRELSIVSTDSARNVLLSWQPPKFPNGQITGYVILWSVDPRSPDRDWTVETINGDRLSTTISNLMPDREYFFKIQARNDKGYGPMSNPKSFQASYSGNHGYASDGPRGEGSAGKRELSGQQDTSSNNSSSQTTLILLTVIGCCGLVLLIAIAAVIFRWRRYNKRGRAGYQAGVKKNGAVVKDSKPDLWIDQERLNMKTTSSGRDSPESPLCSLHDLRIGGATTPPSALELSAAGSDLFKGVTPTQCRKLTTLRSQGTGTCHHSPSFNTLDSRKAHLRMHTTGSPLLTSVLNHSDSSPAASRNGTLSRTFAKTKSTQELPGSALSNYLQLPAAYGTVVYTGPRPHNNRQNALSTDQRDTPLDNRRSFGSGTIFGSPPKLNGSILAPMPTLPAYIVNPVLAELSADSASEHLLVPGRRPVSSSESSLGSGVRINSPMTSFSQQPPPLQSVSPVPSKALYSRSPMGTLAATPSVTGANAYQGHNHTLPVTVMGILPSSSACPPPPQVMSCSNSSSMTRRGMGLQTPTKYFTGFPNVSYVTPAGLQHSNSTEELNAQMQSLDSLMHDLSEISRTEFDHVP